MVKNLKFFLNVGFDSLKEASWGTECNAKNRRSLLSTVYEKIKKNLQKCKFPPKMPVIGTFWWFFFIFSVKILSKDLVFFVLRSVHQDTSFELSKSTFRKISKNLTILGDPFD